MEEPYTEEYWTTALADDSGLAAFDDLLAGLYEVEVSRILDSNELNRAGQTVGVFAGGRRMYVTAGVFNEVAVVPDSRGSLLLNEITLSGPQPWETAGTTYTDGRYFEIYNNSDTTIYMDGKYWGMGWHLNRDYSYWPCMQTEPVRNDPDGVWTQFVFRFPGVGNDFPIYPGDVALIAKAALDHRVVNPDLYDLRHANFEWGGARSADNPDVPNLESVGLFGSMPDFWPWIEVPQFLSEPVDLDALP